ncbi:phage tail tube protein [Lysinibacillus telephonicus]|nr:phage tail tube protein [Lysinibacillus telephonicus]
MKKMNMLLPLDLQFFAETMHARDSISGSQGEAFVTIDNQRYNFAQLINIQADMGKTKTQVPILGKVGKGNKATGAEYTGSATFHFNTSIFREMLYRYKETGEDLYFDIQLTNEDKSSTVGRQTIVLKDCNLDGGILALLDADAEYLEDSFEFTFEDWEMPERFSILDIM